MKPHRILSSFQQKLTVTRVALLSLSVILCGVGLVSGTAHSPQDDPAASAGEEREFKSTVPEHVPIKVKLKNEQSFKRMGNRNWARELEIEVENTGDKPVYFIVINIFLPEFLVGDYPIFFQLFYGERKLAYSNTLARPNDICIRPDESVTLKIPEDQVWRHEQWRDKRGKGNPKKIVLEMAFINFGDGTGMIGRRGRFISTPTRSR